MPTAYLTVIYLILLVLVAILACYEALHGYREQKRGGQERNLVDFVIKVVLLMILIGFLVKMSNWVLSSHWIEID